MSNHPKMELKPIGLIWKTGPDNGFLNMGEKKGTMQAKILSVGHV